MRKSIKKIALAILTIFLTANSWAAEQVDTTKWALARISVAHVRVKPGHSSELSNQAIMGMPIKLISQSGDWWLVETPEGYQGYIIGNSLALKTPEEMKKWRNRPRVIVTSILETKIYNAPSNNCIRGIISDAVNGMILEGAKSGEEFTKVTLPDGREGYIKSTDVTPIEDWASQEFNPQLILDVAYSMHGQPYLWGGTSTKSLDCSGLAKVCYFANGIILRRDAYQQAETGLKIEAKDWVTCQPGDLLFFGNAKTKRVTHVAIYQENGTYIHSSGRVKVNSVDPNSDAYLTTPFFHACRINGAVGTDGITQAINHPWYFNIND